MRLYVRPGHKRVVTVTRDEYNRARMKAPELLTDDYTAVLPLPLRPGEEPGPELAAIAAGLQPGALLIRSRLTDGAYLDASGAYERLALARFTIFAEICQRLGARRLDVAELQQLNDRGKVTAEVDVRTVATKGSGSTSTSWFNRLAHSITASWKWDGGPADVNAAREHATAFGLDTDPMIMGLIRQRDFNNKLGTHELRLDISSEAQREVNSTLELESVLKKVGPAFKGTFDVLREQSSQLELTVKIVFEPDESAGA